MTFEGTEEEKQAEISRLKEELSFGKAQVCAMTDKGQAKGGAQKLKKLEEHLSATVFALKELDESWVPGRWVEQHIHWETKKELPGEAGKRGSNSKEARSSGNDDENDPEEEEDEEDKERADAAAAEAAERARRRADLAQKALQDAEAAASAGLGEAKRLKKEAKEREKAERAAAAAETARLAVSGSWLRAVLAAAATRRCRRLRRRG
mmetsp:Transcript_35133/g.105692  ORF Transcript_35133/g.105692 Transcript_35133/m.105692 type:complete len:208 (-) Transcript_35133:274-897(-)